MGSKNTDMKKNKGKAKKGKDDSKPDPSPPPRHGKVVIDDPRFSRVHTDPRFREAPKHNNKVTIDSRFDRMFTQPSFLPSSAPIDKRGKPKNNSNPNSQLHHYYKREEEEEEKEDHTSSDHEDEENEEEEEEEEEGLIRVNNDTGDELEETTESESAIDTDTDTGTDTDVDEEVHEEEVPDMQEEVAEIENETHRLAVVNMDWRYVKAADLYVLLSSFVPSNGLIKSVTVYPSEFGIQRMEEEDVHGPVALFGDEGEKSDEDSSDDDDDAINEKLRAYEKSRMRYYFAVVECDSSTTAGYIYKECDGLEFLHSSNPLDLRFIPDNMEFKQPPRDVATEIPANYECKDFYSRALQHSKVNLTWDEDEPLRAKTLKRKFNDEQLAQMELKEFLTSDESESDDDEDNNEEDDQPDKKAKKKDKYRALLLSGDGSDGDSERDDDVQDMEVTFNTGLEDLSRHIVEKKDKKTETVWEAYLRKRREKKKARKSKSKFSSDDDDDSDDNDQEAAKEEDDFFEEPVLEKKTSKNDKDHKLEDMDGVDKASKEELELLLADDKGTDTGLKGYNLKHKKGKGKNKENAINEEKIPKTAYEDPRFAALYRPDFAIDPTSPQFKWSASYARQLAQKQQKGHMEPPPEKEPTPKGTQFPSDDSGMMPKGEEGLDVLKSKKDEYELSSLVKSIKMKSKQVQLASDGKTRKDGKSQRKGMEKKRRH